MTVLVAAGTGSSGGGVGSAYRGTERWCTDGDFGGGMRSLLPWCAERLSRFVSRDYTPTVNLSLNSYAATTHCAVDGVVVDVPSRK